MQNTSLQLVPAKSPNRTRPMVSKAVKDAIELQHILLNDARNSQTKPAVRAVLARSWCLLQECIRVMRGIPSPGQLRPDLDPVQMAKALKRSRHRIVHDMPNFGRPMEPMEPPEPNSSRDHEPKQVKVESVTEQPTETETETGK